MDGLSGELVTENYNIPVYDDDTDLDIGKVFPSILLLCVVCVIVHLPRSIEGKG